MNIAEELSKLQELRDRGALSEEEYVKAKAAILNPPSHQPAESSPVSMSPERLAEQERLWAMLMHFSLLLNYAIIGAVLAIVIWQVKKKELPGLDAHGKNITNWIISSILYVAICSVLTVVLIGIPMLIALVVLNIVFPIMGGVKANNGQVWKYPLAITFIK